jgi:protein HOOK3
VNHCSEKSETKLLQAEATVENQTMAVNDLNKKVEELHAKLVEAAHWKDEAHEYKHAADKLQKTELMLEKYKKKMDEANELRRQLKVRSSIVQMMIHLFSRV